MQDIDFVYLSKYENDIINIYSASQRILKTMNLWFPEQMRWKDLSLRINDFIDTIYIMQKNETLSQRYALRMFYHFMKHLALTEQLYFSNFIEVGQFTSYFLNSTIETEDIFEKEENERCYRDLFGVWLLLDTLRPFLTSDSVEKVHSFDSESDKIKLKLLTQTLMRPTFREMFIDVKKCDYVIPLIKEFLTDDGMWKKTIVMLSAFYGVLQEKGYFKAIYNGEQINEALRNRFKINCTPKNFQQSKITNAVEIHGQEFNIIPNLKPTK